MVTAVSLIIIRPIIIIIIIIIGIKVNVSLHGAECDFTQELTGWNLGLTTHLHLVPKLRMNGAIPPIPLYAFKACVKATSPLITASASWPNQISSLR
jgi:predicted  nucleic acid-binding Zn ribbon protein